MNLVESISVDHVFKDIYDALERLQYGQEQTEIIATSIVNCARELRNLERIHSLRWKFYGPNSTGDPFDLVDMLKKFITSCNAYSYIGSPSTFSLNDDEDVPDGCLQVLPAKKSWKKKHFKTLEIDFYEHQRIFSLALANAV
jgi:hypothetical protein